MQRTAEASAMSLAPNVHPSNFPTDRGPLRSGIALPTAYSPDSADDNAIKACVLLHDFSQCNPSGMHPPGMFLRAPLSPAQLAAAKATISRILGNLGYLWIVPGLPSRYLANFLILSQSCFVGLDIAMLNCVECLACRWQSGWPLPRATCIELCGTYQKRLDRLPSPPW